MMNWITEHVSETEVGPSIGSPSSETGEKASIDQIRARIRRYNADVDPSGSTFKAGVLLLAGLEYGHNIDMLANRTGYDRCFVARCARRLIDNGVWKQGRTIADWSQADEASGTFWNDVAVAEGRMCRRLDEGGRFEWAPAGYWNKSFLFVDPAAKDRVAATYLDATQPTAQPASPIAAPASAPAVPEPGRMIGGLEPGSPTSSDAHTNGYIPPLHAVFADVVWIG